MREILTYSVISIQLKYSLSDLSVLPRHSQIFALVTRNAFLVQCVFEKRSLLEEQMTRIVFTRSCFIFETCFIILSFLFHLFDNVKWW